MAKDYATIKRELNGISYEIELEAWAELIDESFDHAFGTHDPGYGVEVTDIEILTVWNDEGEVITSRTIIKQLENMIDIDDKDLKYLEFDFSE